MAEDAQSMLKRSTVFSTVRPPHCNNHAVNRSLTCIHTEPVDQGALPVAMRQRAYNSICALPTAGCPSFYSHVVGLVAKEIPHMSPKLMRP